MPNIIPNNVLQYFMDNTVALARDTIYAALFDTHFEPLRTHDNYGEVKAEQITGGGYVEGGVELTGTSFVLDEDLGVAIFDADDSLFANIIASDVRWAMIYKKDVADEDCKIITFYDFGADNNPAGAALRVRWGLQGLLTVGQVT